jgi:DNA-binding transcriptional MerR regulator
MAGRTPSRSTARHPVGLVADRTGLTPDVLRAWERRYRVVAPGRGDGGHRLYSDDDVHRLTLLSKLARNGRQVGRIASLTIAALERLVAEDAGGQASRERPAHEHHARAIAAARALDTAALSQALRRALLSLGTPAFLEDVLAPVITGIGDDWHEGRIGVAHEHAATAAIEHLLAWIVREFDVGGNAPRVLLATPAGERHALGAMIAAAAASHDQWSVTWLGTDLPAAQIAAAAAQHAVHVVGLSAVAPNRGAARAEIETVRRELDDAIPLLIGGAAADLAKDLDGVVAVRDLTHWRALLRQHAPPSTAVA